MSKEIGFDNEKYLTEQTEAILERVNRFNNKLYLEFGGKILFDYHATRVLPGFMPDVKMRLLQKLKDQADVILCIYAGDIEKKKVRADFGITYDGESTSRPSSSRDMKTRHPPRPSRINWNAAISEFIHTNSRRATQPMSIRLLVARVMVPIPILKPKSRSLSSRGRDQEAAS